MLNGKMMDELQMEFVKCRTLGHAWDDYSGFDNDRQVRVFTWQEAFRCTRCGTVKYESYNVKGEIAQRQYVYPDGYAMAEKATRAEFRLEMRRRKREAGRLVRKNKRSG